MMVTAKYMKACLSHNFRFARQAKLIATEVGYYNADFMAYLKDKLVEVEIKVTESDLRNDFKKPKHKIYALGVSDWVPHLFYFAVPERLADFAIAKCIDTNYGVMVVHGGGEILQWTDTYYKGVPPSHAKSREKVLKKLYKRFTDFKVVSESTFGRVHGEGEHVTSIRLSITYESQWDWSKRVKIVRRAKPLRKGIVSKKVLWDIIARLSSEMSNLRSSEWLEKSVKSK